MASDGKQLEGLVAFVEKTLLPQGFSVETNKRVFNDDGIQIAEFDIEIRGKVGSTEFTWLIECRDRPSQGPAPNSWIEQLVGRRARFSFNKITAVSTTGFATGVYEFAKNHGIELREVKELSPEEFGDWLLLKHITRTERIHKLEHASILIPETESPEKRDALWDVVSSLSGNSPFLQSSRTGEALSPTCAFMAAVCKNESLFEGIGPDGPSRPIRLHVRYPNDDDHFVVQTKCGSVRIAEIVFFGELSIRRELTPLEITAEYRQSDNGEVISQLASFPLQNVHGMSFSLEMHRMAETGNTHVILRRTDK
jgi:hypothetical protein